MSLYLFFTKASRFNFTRAYSAKKLIHIYFLTHTKGTMNTLHTVSPNLSSTPASISLLSNMTTLSSTDKPQKRCGFSSCKKKLQFSDFECRCGTRYCGDHKGSMDHACTFDYKADATKNLSTQMVKCAGERMRDKL